MASNTSRNRKLKTHTSMQSKIPTSQTPRPKARPEMGQASMRKKPIRRRSK